jgi:F-type H+-transporting ATPase subunit a
VLAAFEFPPISHLFVWPEIALEGTPFAINKVVLVLWLSSIAVVLFFFAASARARKGTLVPTGVQNVAEAGYDLVEQNIALEVMGHDGKKWSPFLNALFWWILFANLIGLFPLVQLPVASKIAIPMFLALMIWVLMIFMGFKAQGPRYITNSIFPPGVPKPLYLLVTPIELVSKFLVRPFSHMVRLFANLMAGHILLATFALLTAALWLAKWNAVFLPLPLFMGIAMTGFEVLVAVLQAYIFTILAAVYIGESLHPEH